MDEQEVIYEVGDGVARVTLNRPEKLNALTSRMLTQLHDALWEADDDTSVHCVVLKGAGRAFCAGFDLSGIGQQRDASSVPGWTQLRR